MDFRAFMSIEPWGVMSVDLIDGFRLWRAADWLRHRGKRGHYDDMRTGRTTAVDHFEFTPTMTAGFGLDQLQTRIVRVSMAMIYGIAISAEIDERYLRRCFDRDDAERIMCPLRARLHTQARAGPIRGGKYGP